MVMDKIALTLLIIGGLNWGSVGPVSYTHLDVYKRQHGVYAIGGHGLDIGLDTGASAGVGPSDRQCCFHCENSFLCLH